MAEEAEKLNYETKDPAVLWYWNDWAGGTKRFSRFLKGCYMDLLDAQFNGGNLSLEEIKTVLGSDFGSSWPALQKKFSQDSEGLYFNKRLTFEAFKRSNYSKSRKNNLKGKDHMIAHMEDENEIENRRLKFKMEVDNYKDQFSEKIIEYFLGYWLEMNKGKTKFRFEKETFFDFKKRLQTFERNDKRFEKQTTTVKSIDYDALEKELEKL